MKIEMKDVRKIDTVANHTIVYFNGSGAAKIGLSYACSCWPISDEPDYIRGENE